MISIDCLAVLPAFEHRAIACTAALWHREHGRQFWSGELCCRRLSFHVSSTIPIPSIVSMAADDSAHKRDGYDEMQALILSSPPYGTKGKSNPTSQSPTLLEREALAMEGVSSDFSLQERGVAMNELLDLLEQKGVPPAYAFEFVRHATRLLDEMIAAAKEGCADSTGEIPLDSISQEQALLAGGTHTSCADRIAAGTIASSSWSHDSSKNGGSAGNTGRHISENIRASPSLGKAPSSRIQGRNTKGLGQSKTASEAPFASKVSSFAEQRGIPRLVYYFHMLNMKALDIPKVLPFVGQRIDAVMAKVEFLRTIGVKASHLPTVIASWPQLLSYECDQLALVEEFLKGLGFTHKEIGTFAQKHPQVLGLDVETELRSTPEFLERLGVPPKDLKKLIIRHPVLIIEGAEKSLKPLVAYLESIGSS